MCAIRGAQGVPRALSQPAAPRRRSPRASATETKHAMSASRATRVSRAPSRASQTVHAAAAGVSAHVTYQIASRVASFLMKAVVFRTLGPERVADTELNVALVVSLLILPISGFRKVSLRAPNDAHAVALCVVCVFVAAAVAIAGTALLALINPANTPALCIVAVSLVIRALAEPDVIFTSRRERYSANSRSRALSVFMSGFVGAVAVRAAPAALAAPATALGHLAYTISMLFTFRFARGQVPVPYRALRRMQRDLNWDELSMAAATTWQCLLKYFLSNGESFVLALTCSKKVQGAYILAGNIASIVARFLFDGLEDQCFNVFHRLAPAFRQNIPVDAAGSAPTSNGAVANGATANGALATNGSAAAAMSEDDQRDAQRTCVAIMHLSLKASFLAAVLFAWIGPAYAYSCVRLLYDVEWSENSPVARLLSLYFVYLIFMAANGITEAFFHAAAVAADSRQHWMFSAVLGVSYLALLRIAANSYQAAGIIAVNCLNMACRTIYSCVFYCKLTKQRVRDLVRGTLPNPGVLFAVALARQVSMRSEVYFVGTRAGVRIRDVAFEGRIHLLRVVGMHALSGVFAVAVFVGALVTFESRFLRDVVRLVRGRPVAGAAATEGGGHEHEE